MIIAAELMDLDSPCGLLDLELLITYCSGAVLTEAAAV